MTHKSVIDAQIAEGLVQLTQAKPSTGKKPSVNSCKHRKDEISHPKRRRHKVTPQRSMKNYHNPNPAQT